MERSQSFDVALESWIAWVERLGWFIGHSGRFYYLLAVVEDRDVVTVGVSEKKISCIGSRASG